MRHPRCVASHDLCDQRREIGRRARLDRSWLATRRGGPTSTASTSRRRRDGSMVGSSSSRSSGPSAASRRLLACPRDHGRAYGIQRIIWPFIPAAPHLLFYPASSSLHVSRSAAGTCHGRRNLGDRPRLPTARWASRRRRRETSSISRSSAARDRDQRVGRPAAQSAGAGAARDGGKAVDRRTWSMVAHDLRTPLTVITMARRPRGEVERHARHGAERSVSSSARRFAPRILSTTRSTPCAPLRQAPRRTGRVRPARAMCTCRRRRRAARDTQRREARVRCQHPATARVRQPRVERVLTTCSTTRSSSRRVKAASRFMSMRPTRISSSS